MAEEREKWKKDQIVQREAEKIKQEARKRQNAIELERIRAERERKALEKAELMKLQQQEPALQQAVAARGD